MRSDLSDALISVIVGDMKDQDRNVLFTPGDYTTNCEKMYVQFDRLPGRGGH